MRVGTAQVTVLHGLHSQVLQAHRRVRTSPVLEMLCHPATHQHLHLTFPAHQQCQEVRHRVLDTHQPRPVTAQQVQAIHRHLQITALHRLPILQQVLHTVQRVHRTLQRHHLIPLHRQATAQLVQAILRLVQVTVQRHHHTLQLVLAIHRLVQVTLQHHQVTVQHPRRTPLHPRLTARLVQATAQLVLPTRHRVQVTRQLLQAIHPAVQISVPHLPLTALQVQVTHQHPPVTPLQAPTTAPAVQVTLPAAPNTAHSHPPTRQPALPTLHQVQSTVLLLQVTRLPVHLTHQVPHSIHPPHQLTVHRRLPIARALLVIEAHTSIAQVRHSTAQPLQHTALQARSIPRPAHLTLPPALSTRRPRLRTARLAHNITQCHPGMYQLHQSIHPPVQHIVLQMMTVIWIRLKSTLRSLIYHICASVACDLLKTRVLCNRYGALSRGTVIDNKLLCSGEIIVKTLHCTCIRCKTVNFVQVQMYIQSHISW